MRIDRDQNNDFIKDICEEIRIKAIRKELEEEGSEAEGKRMR